MIDQAQTRACSLYKPSQSSSLSDAGPLSPITHRPVITTSSQSQQANLRMVATMSQVMALLSSALSGTGVAVAVAASADEGDRWRRCGHDHAAAGYCCVCISTCRDGEEMRRLPCGHAFHRDCVDRWLARCRRTCPLCRLHVGGVWLMEEQHQLSEDLVIWFSSLFVAGL
ncbi:uncharacterized protein LOC133903841 [Phragmites australis]|uniref:uncharacterized protein LOC133903841 n=1 Tax=Phragmites australis TaxID=29695 RepID=UPI002D76B44F|nr:uncharacterized protein LOC133903841 [Phragmites australis]